MFRGQEVMGVRGESVLNKDLLLLSQKVTPGGIHSQRRQVDPPLSLVRAKGPHVWDSSGKQYIDFHAAFGAIILGHGDSRVVEGVRRGLEAVDLVGVGVTPAEVELSERLVAAVPCFDQVLLCNSGSEATLHAVRLARAVTGRSHVIKFQGAYHGTHDYLLRNSFPACLREAGAADPDPQAGVFASATEATLVCRYNDLESVRTVVDAYRERVCAIVVEPYGHNIGGAAPVPGFLEGLRTISSDIGALLVFDEVITGIRHGLGGYQAVSSVTPDVATLAKALGNGLPIGAIGGRREYMRRFNTDVAGDVLYSGTFNGGGGPVGAALGVIDALLDGTAYKHMASLAMRMREGLEGICKDAGVAAHISGFGGVFHTCFGPGPIKSQEDVSRNDLKLYQEFRRQMLARGVLDSGNPQTMRSAVSASHTAADIDTALEAARESLRAAVRVLGR
jgi:glutamate-1-semialdehyde 2,1-aminomutase